MKLRDIFEAVGNRTDWIHFDSVWSVDNMGNVNVGSNYNINLEDDVELVYYWYHHMMPNDIRDDVSTTINNHDYDTFLKYFESGYVHLPSDATIYYNDEIVGSVCIAYCEDVFNLITYSECECG